MLYAAMLGAPLSHMPAITRAAPVRPPPPPPPAAVPQEPLRVFLAPEIKQGLVRVLGDHAMPIVRIRNSGMFASGSATVAPKYVPLLQRIGQALKQEKGPVQVVGYTDNQPIHTVRFPSNYQLSKSRAEAARAIIVRALGEPGRVTAEGRADADPIASNATPAGPGGEPPHRGGAAEAGMMLARGTGCKPPGTVRSPPPPCPSPAS